MLSRGIGLGLGALALAVAIVDAGEPPTILRHPVSQRVFAGESVLFEVRATDPARGPLTYEWWRNKEILGITNDSQLSFANVSIKESGIYEVRVRNASGTTQSLPFDLRVAVPEWQPGVHDRTFHLPAFEGDEVHSVLALEGGKVVIGGDFARAGERSPPYLARLLSSGAVDLSFNPGGEGPNGTVRVVAALGNRIMIGGAFTSYNGAACHHLALLESDGTLATDFQHGVVTDHEVRAIIPLPNGQVLIGGLFKKVQGQDAPYLARLHSNGTLDPAFQAANEINLSVLAIACDRQDRLLVGGRFNSSLGDGNVYDRVARLLPDGAIDSSFPEGGTNNEVTCIAIASDGSILLGGPFRTLYGESVRGVARLRVDGSFDPLFPNTLPSPLSISDLKFDAEDRLLIAGGFTEIAGRIVPGIVRFDQDGKFDDSFVPPVSIDDEVNAIAIQDDGMLVLGGQFERPHAAVMRVWGNPPAGFPPQVVPPPAEVITSPGRRLSLEVAASANPPARYTWRFNGEIIPGLRTPELHLTPFRKENSGSYEITVENPFGSPPPVRVRVDADSPLRATPRSRDYDMPDDAQIIPNQFGSQLESSIEVFDTFDVQSVSITLHIQHDDVSELEGFLRAPNGEEVQLFRKPGGGRSGRNFERTVFDERSPKEIEDGVAPFLGAYQIQDERGLRVLRHQPASGVWTLRLQDLIHGKRSGRLLGWTLTLMEKVSPPTYESWQQAALAAGAIDIQREEDANGDGLSNWFSYALAANPLETPRSLTIQSLSKLEHQRWAHPEALQFGYEVSNDLQTWRPAEEGLDYQITHRLWLADGREITTLRTLRPFSKAFVRLKLSGS